MPSNPLSRYLGARSPSELSTEELAYVANLELVSRVDPGVARAVVEEFRDQRLNLKLIASENYSSLSVQSAMANLLTDKYAEGFPTSRFYAGCANVDTIETRACDLANRLFGSEHAYVQPHSGADANLIAFWAILQDVLEAEVEKRNIKSVRSLDRGGWEEIRAALGSQRILGMDFSAGGHLTHGYRLNVSGKMFDAYSYGVDSESGLVDYEALRQQARDVRPLILIAGYSAYPRALNFRIMREIADDVGAKLMVDMAHFAGLVAGKQFVGDEDPVPHAHVLTSTTHKTLRGPRGGLILCQNEFAQNVDKGCPLVIGGPLPHVMAAKSICFQEALTEQFQEYSRRVIENAKTLAGALRKQGLEIITGGTDNHIVLVDVTSYGLTGLQAENALRQCRVTLNRNAIPGDPRSPIITSGIRMGTAAVTTLGMGEAEMQTIADLIHSALRSTTPKGQKSWSIDAGTEASLVERVTELQESYPVYAEIDLEALSAAFGAHMNLSSHY